MAKYVSDSFSKASKDVVSTAAPIRTSSNQLSNSFGAKAKQGFPADSVNRTANSKITEEMTNIAYEVAKRVYSRRFTRQEGKLEIAKQTGMNPGSAQDYITCFLAMMEGREYHRTMSNLGTVCFLENIRKDFGEKAFQLALEATEKHIKYYNSLGYGQLKAKEEIVRRLKETM